MGKFAFVLNLLLGAFMLLFYSCFGHETNNEGVDSESSNNESSFRTSTGRDFRRGIFLEPEMGVLELYVSVSDGDNENEGTFSNPLATLNEAINRANAIGDIDVKVYLREGEYYLDKSISLTGAELKIKSLVISNYQNETVTLSGGVILGPQSFEKFKEIGKNEYIYSTSISKEIENDIDEFAKLRSTGYNEPINRPIGAELFFEEEPMHLARFPNTSEIEIQKVIQSDPNKLLQRSVIQFSPKAKLNWKQREDIWIAGRFSFGWSSNSLIVKEIDLDKNLITTVKTPQYGFYATEDASTAQLRAARKLRTFYFFNVFDELDSKGEWFFDKHKRQIFFIPLAADIAKNKIRLSVLGEPIIGIKDSEVPITIQGIRLGYVRGSALEITNSRNVKISNCEFLNIGVRAINIENCYSTEVVNCKIFNTGADGIFMTGGDRQTLTASNNSVKDCEFYNTSRYFRSYSPAIRLGGVGNLVANCYIHDLPGQAIVFGGNDHIIQNNYIKNVCLEFADMGGIYTGRDPSATGTVIKQSVFENIRNPYSEMVAAIYLDDGNSGITIEDNVFINCGSIDFGAITINGGFANKLIGNTFVDCHKAYYSKFWSKNTLKQTFFDDPQNLRKFTEVVDIKSKKYSEKYPHLADFLNYEKAVRKNYIRGSEFHNVQHYGYGEGFETSEKRVEIDKKSLSQEALKKIDRWKIDKKSLKL